MPTVSVYRSRNVVHDTFLDAMYDSCPYEKTWVEDQQYRAADIGVLWGLPKEKVPISWWRREVFDTHDVIVLMDSGYVRRGDGVDNYQMVALDGLNGRGGFRFDKADSKRWPDLGVEIAPWREDGNHILVVGQVPWDASVQNSMHVKWLRDTVHELQRHTKRPIRFRPHPKAWQHCPPIKGASYSRRAIEKDLEDCWCAVTFNSNVGVDAVLAGVPVIAMDRGSMAYDVADHDLRSVEAPTIHEHRQIWAERLAYTQWNLEEMQQGLPWRHLFDE